MSGETPARPKPPVRSLVAGEGFVSEIWSDSDSGKVVRAISYTKDQLDQQKLNIQNQAANQIKRIDELLAKFEA